MRSSTYYSIAKSLLIHFGLVKIEFVLKYQMHKNVFISKIQSLRLLYEVVHKIKTLISSDFLNSKLTHTIRNHTVGIT